MYLVGLNRKDDEYMGTVTIKAPNSSNNTLAVASGGTGASTAAAARTNLDVYSKSEVTSRISQSTADVVGRLEIRTVTGTISNVAAGSGGFIDLAFPAVSGKSVQMVALSLPGGFNLTPAWIQSWSSDGCTIRAYNARTSAVDIAVSVTALYW